MEDLELYEGLKQKLGPELSKALYDRLQGKSGELATKKDLNNLGIELKAHITQELANNNVNMVWKVAGFLLAQTGIIVALIKFLP